MHLTRYTDYSLRVLLYLGLKGDGLVTIRETANAYGVSRNHLLKVVSRLSSLGYVETAPGKSGGMRLARRPRDINLGRVVREMEPNFHVVECFDKETDACPITSACALKDVLEEALERFFGVLDGYTLEDLLHDRSRLLSLLPLGSGG